MEPETTSQNPTQNAVNGGGSASDEQQRRHQIDPGYEAAPYTPYPAPANPYATPAATPAPPFYGAPGPWSTPSTPMPGTEPPRKKRRKGLVIALVILVVLLALGGGTGAFAYVRYHAPQNAALQFCSLLEHQDYASAYADFSISMKSRFTQQVFTDEANTLDQVEGSVNSCEQTASSAGYSYRLFGDTATFAATVSRTEQGTLQGVIHLSNENGSWMIDGLDSSLLGVNLYALKTAQDFCAALNSGDANAVYGLLGSNIQNTVTQRAFADDMAVHRELDGAVTSCKVVNISHESNDQSATVTVAMTHTIHGPSQEILHLGSDSGSWKITTLDARLGGTDLGPYHTVLAFCSNLINGDLTSAYQQFSTAFQADNSPQDFTSYFTLNRGDKFTNCTLTFKSYQVSEITASFTIDLFLEIRGTPKYVKLALTFVLEGQEWKIDDYTLS